MSNSSEIFSVTLRGMAGKMCNTNRLVQIVSVFVSEFIRSTYGFLTPNHVEQLRTFRNEVEDNYPACPLVITPWKDEKKRSAADSETETEDDRIPTKKRTRELSSSTSTYKDYSTSESSNPFASSPKKVLIRNGQVALMMMNLIRTQK